MKRSCVAEVIRPDAIQAGRFADQYGIHHSRAVMVRVEPVDPIESSSSQREDASQKARATAARNHRDRGIARYAGGPEDVLARKVRRVIERSRIIEIVRPAQAR